MFAVGAGGVADIEAAGGHCELQGVSQAQTEELADDEARVEVISGTRGDLGLGCEGADDGGFSFAISSASVVHGVDDDGVEGEFLTNGACE